MTTETRTGTRGGTTRLGETVTRGRRVSRRRSAALALRAAGGRLGSAARAAAAWLGATVTALGWVLVIVLVAGLVLGIGFGLVEAWVAAVIALVLILLAVPFLLGGASYRVEFALDRDRVVAGSLVGARLRVVNTSRRVALPGVLDVPVGPGLVETAIPLLRRGAAHEETVQIAAPRRGIIQVGPMMITRGDPLGVLRRDLTWPQVELVHVHPLTVPLPATSAGFIKDVDGRASQTIVDSDLAFHAIREYAPGDSWRHVHWKSTAKTGMLMVRQFEESRRARIAVVLDVRAGEYTLDPERPAASAPGSRGGVASAVDPTPTSDEFELAVSCAASLGVQAVRDGRDVLMVTAGQEAARRGAAVAITSLPTVSPKALLDATCLIELDAGAEALEAVTTLAAQTYPDLTIVVLVTGSRIEPLRLRRAVHAFPPGVVTVVVRVEPGAEPSLRRTRDFTLVTVGTLGDLKQLLARGALE